MLLRSANTRRKRKTRRLSLRETRQILFNIYKDDPQCDDGQPRLVKCAVCSEMKPFYSVSATGICADC